MDERIARLAEKFRLTCASGAAAPFSRIGMRNEPYVLNLPLPVERVVEFEKQHGIRLPEEYRRFLTEIGDGDTTPSGLYSLSDAFAELADVWDDEDEFTDGAGVLAQPSRYRRGQTYDVRWWDDNAGPDERFDQLFGTLPVSGAGCSDFYLIVVNGPDTGAIYSANWDGNAGPTRVADDFLSWQESNVDSRVFGYAERWGDGAPKGRAPELVRILTGEPHEYRRMWAALGLQRPWRLTDLGRQALRDALGDDHYIVRAMAVNTIRHRGLRALIADVRGALADTSSTVRYRAFMTLESFQVPDIAEVATTMLSDALGWTREHAIRVLHKAGALTVEHVLELLDDPEWTVRREAMHHAPELSDPGGEIHAKALRDTHHPIRSLAVDLALHRDDRTLLPEALARETDPTVRRKLEFALRG